ncbi:MAG: hypothetical protein IKO61_12480 [Lachnospiraceae bacterium]|nr:hypothetical protein [Lachnospiraceae bacterium]
MDDTLLKQQQQQQTIQVTKEEQKQEQAQARQQVQQQTYAPGQGVQIELPKGPEYIGTASKEEIIKKQAEFKNAGEQNKDYKFSDLAPKEPVTAEDHLERLTSDASQLLKGSDTFGDSPDMAVLKDKLKTLDAVKSDDSLSEAEKTDHMVSAVYGLINSAERYQALSGQ